MPFLFPLPTVRLKRALLDLLRSRSISIVGIMSDDEHHFESKADAGASKTYPQQAGTIRKNGYIVIKGRPCKVRVSCTDVKKNCGVYPAMPFGGRTAVELKSDVFYLCGFCVIFGYSIFWVSLIEDSNFLPNVCPN